jgi:membrane-associated phospholipid phosphatase
VALVRLLAFDVHWIHHADALTLHGFMSLDRPAIHPIAARVASIADPQPYAAIGALLMAIALVQGKAREALGVALILGGAAVTTDKLLKPTLATPRFDAILGDRQIPATGFPSGHATASMALALCAIIVVSPTFRPYVAALGAAFAVAVSYSFMSLGWHYPSDVLGGFLVAATWTCLAVAALRAAEARWPSKTARRAARQMLSRLQVRVLAGAGAALVLLAVIVVAATAPERALDFLRVHTIFAVGAAAIALAGVAVAGVLTAILRD